MSFGMIELSTLAEKYKNNLTSIVSDSQGRDWKDIKLYILLHILNCELFVWFISSLKNFPMTLSAQSLVSRLFDCSTMLMLQITVLISFLKQSVCYQVSSKLLACVCGVFWFYNPILSAVKKLR